MCLLTLSGGELLITDQAWVWHLSGVFPKMNLKLSLSGKLFLADITTEFLVIMKSFVAAV